MGARNTSDGFGWVTRVLHWAMAVGIIAMLALGLTLARMQPNLSTIWLYGLHKSVGFLLLAGFLLRVVWHWVSPPPPPDGPRLEATAARVVHWAFYALMGLLPLSGWIGSAATGLSTYAFGLGPLPVIAPVSETWENAGFGAHRLLGYAMIILLAVHITAALFHHFVRRDDILRRIVRG